MLSAFRRTGVTAFRGTAFEPDEPGRKLVVEILVDGVFYTTVRADEIAPEALPEHHGSGHGFSLSLPLEVVRHAVTVEARLANASEVLGPPIHLGESWPAVHARVSGEARWLGALQIAGWIADETQAPLSIVIDGVTVDRIRPTAWHHVHDTHGAGAARAFSVHLPERFADGTVHRCSVITATGDDLPGNPFTILAFPDTLRSLVVGRGLSKRDLLRATLFDRLVPASIPMQDYETWRTGQPALGQEPDGTGCVVILVGDGDAEATLASLREQTCPDWIAACVPGQNPVGFSPHALQDVLSGAGPAYPIVVFVLAGSILHSAALARFVAAFAASDDVAIVYPDVEIEASDRALWPLAFPAFDYTRLLEQGYCAHVFAMTRPAVERGLAVGAGDLYRLFTVALDDGTDPGRAIVHLPGALATLPPFDHRAAASQLAASSVAHLGQLGYRATAIPTDCGTLPSIRLKRESSGERVTVMIPTRNRRDLLERCLASIAPAIRMHDADILILDNDSSDPEACRYLRGLEADGIRRLGIAGPFNFAHLNNVGARAAQGQFLCLLNNDVEALDADWLDTLLGAMADPEVGAVAPLLLWPSRVVQHGGLVLGPKGEAAPAFTDRLEGDPGYADLLRVAHECSAVTAACMVTRRADYLSVGGMDETLFPINFNDVDYCLKLRAIGRRIVFTPHARLLHAESSSRGRTWTADRQRLFERERRALQLKWGSVIAADPYYSPILALMPDPYAGLTTHATAIDPRRNSPPVPIAVPLGF